MKSTCHDYAIIVTCNPGYGFGLMASMNAQNYFGTHADWEIAYDGFDQEYMDKVSNAFPFKVNWTPVSELMEDVVDKRTDQTAALERMWLSYWLLAHKVLKEKKYKAVCVIQADQFVFVNLDPYFKLAEEGYLIGAEQAFSYHKLEDLPFGNDEGIWDRSMCAAFDGVNFIGQQHTQFPMDTVHFQEEDSFDGEANHSVVALNRSYCRHGQKNNVLGLDRAVWTCDHIWPYTKLRVHVDNDRIYNDRNVQLKGWHCRWWQIGRVAGEWLNNKQSMIDNKDNAEVMGWFENMELNYNVVKSFMERFNDMIPEIKSEQYVKGIIRRPRYELGEE